jgi:hypothetical protein
MEGWTRGGSIVPISCFPLVSMTDHESAKALTYLALFHEFVITSGLS